MEIQGKIIVALPEMTGTSKAGNPWKKKEYVLETHDSYPKKVHFDFFGDKADQYPLSVGDEITLSFDIESREYQGKWFTSIRGWKAEKAGAAAPGAAAFPPQPAYGAPAGGFQPAAAPGFPPTPASAPGDNNDDLPF